MLTPLLVVVLTAGPVDVVAAWGPEARAALPKLKEGNGTQVDASAVWAYLMHPEGILPLQDFDTFRAPPIAGWPKSLDATWTSGVAYCRALVGPPPWRGNLFALASGCGSRLAQFLWQQFAKTHHADRIFEIDSRVDPQANTSRVTARRWTPNGGKVVLFERSGSAAAARALVEEASKVLLAAKAEGEPFEEIIDLFTPLSADPWQEEEVFTEPFPKTLKSCAKLPAKLTFTSAAPLAKSLASRWAPEGATGAELPCELSFAEHQERVMGQPMQIITSTVTCGTTVAAVEQAKSVSLGRKPLDVVSDRLAQLLASQLCR